MHSDLGILITLHICMTLVVLLASSFFTWLIVRQLTRSTREMMHKIGNLGAMTQNVAAMTRPNSLPGTDYGNCCTLWCVLYQPYPNWPGAWYCDVVGGSEE